MKLTTQEQWLEWLLKMQIAQISVLSEPADGRNAYEIVAAVLGIVTYDGGMDEILVKKMMPTLLTIGDKQSGGQFDGNDYAWFCIAINMPFLHRRLNWGTSIRGAWYTLTNHPFDPHHGVIGRGSSGFDIIDADVLGAGDEESFVNLIRAMDQFIKQEE